MSGSRMLFLAAAAVAVVAMAAPQARANFSYTSTVNVATAPGTPSNPPGFASATIAIGGGNQLEFTTSFVTALDASLPGGTDINYGNIDFQPSNTGTVVSYAVAFNYAVEITDSDSGDSGTVNFTGLVSGFARGTPSAINGTVSMYAVAPATLTLGNNIYTITVAPSSGPGTGLPGVLRGNVSVRPVPEPSTLALVGLGGLGLIGLRARRRAA